MCSIVNALQLLGCSFDRARQRRVHARAPGVRARWLLRNAAESCDRDRSVVARHEVVYTADRRGRSQRWMSPDEGADERGAASALKRFVTSATHERWTCRRLHGFSFRAFPTFQVKLRKGIFPESASKSLIINRFLCEWKVCSTFNLKFYRKLNILLIASLWNRECLESILFPVSKWFKKRIYYYIFFRILSFEPWGRLNKSYILYAFKNIKVSRWTQF